MSAASNSPKAVPVLSQQIYNFQVLAPVILDIAKFSIITTFERLS